MRAIWKGSINFGLVYIPVSVYPATKEEKISFRQLRATDLSPIRYKKVAEADQKEVPADQIVKGFEYEKGKWITLRDEDFEKVQIESTHSVEITDFVDQASDQSEILLQTLFSRTAKRRRESLRAVAQGSDQSGKVGVAKVAIQKREYLAAVKPDGLFLILELMHFAQEVLEPVSLNNGADRAVSLRS